MAKSVNNPTCFGLSILKAAGKAAKAGAKKRRPKSGKKKAPNEQEKPQKGYVADAATGVGEYAGGAGSAGGSGFGMIPLMGFGAVAAIDGVAILRKRQQRVATIRSGRPFWEEPHGKGYPDEAQ